MKVIYYFGRDTSIFESLESLSKIKKSFVIKRFDIMQKKGLNNTILVLDDSFKDFIKIINIYAKKNKTNLIVTTKKENITINSLQDFKTFLKPIKILDLYKEILKKIKNNLNDPNLIINRADFSLTDKKGKKLKLTEKEFKLMGFLLNNNQKPLSKKILLYRVWGLRLEQLESINTRVLETLISRIRKKIILSNLDIAIIKSKSGYSLVK